jgi:uncharacterized protein with GYD domain
MSTYVSLINWTDEGAKTASNTVDRAEAALELAKAVGGTMQFLWTMGQYDLVTISEFPDDETAVATLAKIAAGGHVRTQTMRAFNADEVRGIMARM